RGGPLAPVAGAASCLALLAAGPAWSQEVGGSAGDESLRAALTRTAERVLLPERCGECHAAELEVWEGTAHADGFDTLHRGERAKEIYRSLGLRLIKRGTDEATPACLSCHYTPVLRRGQLRAGAGVTCESCHGAARDWIAVHNNYDVAESDFQQAARLETAGHRAQRIADSTAAGMRRPSQIYEVAANCFGCHTVPNEDLVNRAGHSTGSDFELVSWSGRIRHNFLESYKTADGRTNAERPRAWKRLMYVVGRALDVEYALRGVAAATRDDLYAAAMSDRAGAAIDELFAINDYVEIPAVQAIIAISETVDLAVGNRGALLAAADAVQAAVKAFIGAADGDGLAAIDHLWDPDLEEPPPASRPVTDAAIEPDSPLLPAEGATPGLDAPVDEASAAAAPAPGREAARDEAARDEAARAAEAAPAQNAAVAPPRDEPAAAPAPPAPVVTLTRPPWREPPDHDFVKVPCGRCHNAQEKWWRRDPHSKSAAPLRNGEPRALEIARAYGVAADDVARGTQICMWCHGTTVSNPSRKVRAGVGCQRCHGPGADYIEPHETAGHAESVALGMTDLPDPEAQAATCAGCHYVTDPGLIRAGHPSGADFDVLARRNQIAHWGDAFGRDPLPRDAGALAEAHERVIAARGPVPAAAPAAGRTSSAPGRAASPAGGRRAG
ncbi:MAG: multiheme c-type cytochrome, partial [Acidobacteria bacterium]|nr:multiheme c-type cytochrome [Acidobacteriota bacterium]